MQLENRATFIETERLLISVPRAEDLEELLVLQSHPDVMKFIGNGVRDREEVRIGLEKAILHFEKFQFSLGSVFEKETQQFVGRAGLIHLGLDEKASDIEVAYALLPAFWGLGYASELASNLVQWGFLNLSVSSIGAVAKKENLGSRKVLEKVGMTYVKDVQYHGRTTAFYSIQKPRMD